MAGHTLFLPCGSQAFFCWSFRTSSFFRQMTHIPPKLIWETTGWIKTLLSYFDILFGNKGMKASFFLFFVHNSIYFSCNILRRQACWWYWDSLSCQSSHIFKRQLLHYDPLMISQKEAPICGSWVLPRKGSKMVWISVQFLYKENDGCFLGASWVLPSVTSWTVCTVQIMVLNHLYSL